MKNIITENGLMILQKHELLRLSLKKGEADIGCFVKSFEDILAGEDEVKTYLKSLEKKDLLGMMTPMGRYRYKYDKKDRIVSGVFNSIIDSYVLGKGYSYDPFSPDGRIGAIRKIVSGFTDDDLKDYARMCDEALMAQKLKIECHKKALSEPETLEEFEIFISFKGKEKLTSIQLEKYDELKAFELKNMKIAEDDRKAIVAGVDLENAQFEIIKGIHTKKNHDIWTVRLSERVDNETFKELVGKAKRLGGYYSSYNGGGAVKGFVFTSEEDANKFVSLKDGDVSAKENILEKKQEQKTAAINRLLKMAEDVESKAEESLSKNRLANTHRRIRIAEQAEKQAERDKAFAVTLRNIASAITDGMATHLENLTQKVQLEELERILNRAAWSEFHSKSQEYSGNRPEQPTRECVAFAKLPELSIEKSNAERVLAYHGNKDGFKLLAVQLRNRVKSANGESVLLDEAFARKLVEKVGKDLDWLSSDLNTLDRLSRMGIVTDEQLRAALRELIGIRETAKEPDKLKQMKRDLVGTKIPGFFPTPRKVVELMLQEAEIKPGMTVLEPSAGSGNIAAVVKELHPEAEIQVIEINFTLREILHQQGFNIVGNNFLDHNDSYDRIIMNPPFEIHQDIDHVHHAFNLLKPGGKLISIMCEGTFFRSDPKSRFFREWLNDDVNASMVKLEDGAFLSSDRPTGVATRMVVIDKAMQS